MVVQAWIFIPSTFKQRTIAQSRQSLQHYKNRFDWAENLDAEGDLSTCHMQGAINTVDLNWPATREPLACSTNWSALVFDAE